MISKVLASWLYCFSFLVSQGSGMRRKLVIRWFLQKTPVLCKQRQHNWGLIVKIRVISQDSSRSVLLYLQWCTRNIHGSVKVYDLESSFSWSGSKMFFSFCRMTNLLSLGWLIHTRMWSNLYWAITNFPFSQCLLKFLWSYFFDGSPEQNYNQIFRQTVIRLVPINLYSQGPDKVSCASCDLR